MVVVWSDEAKADLKKAYKYIALTSLQNATIVLNTLIDCTFELSANPEKYTFDKFKKNNDGTWRAFEKYKYRISYRVMGDEIIIVRIRHTKMSPLKF
ncbi:type II toxin-antitoxin system RelE/ParE family toxin [Mucilaginibacter pedocola]|uniref:Plasmid stabilization system protein n=1 Tax=Mucilaginibacter pedocola TaxID=1792845 RepID=A0A1S9PLN6_9SPHI|nr:type II toxin-antitoxin system RelE/ParE family toxin [Mucilaginibacter pedocola]OOQ61849.1 plasmid stabilization system protein [Mucilaginibacter pedocola]